MPSTHLPWIFLPGVWSCVLSNLLQQAAMSGREADCRRCDYSVPHELRSKFIVGVAMTHPLGYFLNHLMALLLVRCVGRQGAVCIRNYGLSGGARIRVSA